MSDKEITRKRFSNEQLQYLSAYASPNEKNYKELFHQVPEEQIIDYLCAEFGDVLPPKEDITSTMISAFRERLPEPFRWEPYTAPEVITKEDISDAFLRERINSLTESVKELSARIVEIEKVTKVRDIRDRAPVDVGPGFDRFTRPHTIKDDVSDLTKK